MRFKAVRAKLLAGINAVKDVTKNESVENPFRFIKVETMGTDCVLLTATDGNMQITSRVFCEVSEEGRLSLVGPRFARFVAGLPEGPVEIWDSSVSRASIEGAGTKFTLARGTVDDFPVMKGPVSGSVLDLEGSELREIVRKTRYAASSDKTHISLCGVHFSASKSDPESTESTVSVVGVDGKRLSAVMFGRETGFVADGTIPGVVLDIVDRLSAKWEEDGVSVEMDADAVRFTSKLWSVTSKLLAGKFPSWKNVIPADVKREVKVDRVAFVGAVKTAALATLGDGCGVKITFGGNEVKVEAHSGISGGVSREKVEYAGEAFSVLVNPKLVEDALGCLDAETVTLGFNDGLQPFTVRCDLPGFVAVIVPMRED